MQAAAAALCAERFRGVLRERAHASCASKEGHGESVDAQPDTIALFDFNRVRRAIPL